MHVAITTPTTLQYIFQTQAEWQKEIKADKENIFLSFSFPFTNADILECISPPLGINFNNILRTAFSIKMFSEAFLFFKFVFVNFDKLKLANKVLI